MSASRLNLIDSVIEESIRNKECPGAVVIVGRHGTIVFRKAYGHRAVLPSLEPMTLDTVFDLASLTKVVATAPSVMALVEDGRLRLQDRVAKHLPEFATGGGARDQVTVEQLLTHRAGLAADDPMALYTGTPKEIFERKYRQPLVSAPGSRFLYSDVGFEVLRAREAGVVSPARRIRASARLRSAGMNETEFRPGGAGRLPLPYCTDGEDRRQGPSRRRCPRPPRLRARRASRATRASSRPRTILARFCGASSRTASARLKPATVRRHDTCHKFFSNKNLHGLGMRT